MLKNLNYYSFLVSSEKIPFTVTVTSIWNPTGMNRNMDSAKTIRNVNEIGVSPSSARKMDPSESSPTKISEQSSTIGTISTEEILELSLLQVRKNKDKNETEKDYG